MPLRSPNLDAYAESFLGPIKSECMNRLIFSGEASGRAAMIKRMLRSGQ